MSVLLTCINKILRNNKLVFFGCGTYSRFEIQLLHGHISYFVDNNSIKQGNTFCGKPIYAPTKLLEEDAKTITVIINSEFYNEIAEQLFSLGITDIYSREYQNAIVPLPQTYIKETHFLAKKYEALQKYDLDGVINLFDDNYSKTLYREIVEKYRTANMNFKDLCSSEAMYFNGFFDNLTDSEVFADCGAYNGENIAKFIIFTNGKYGKIYSFEADEINYKTLSMVFADMPNVEILNMAIGAKYGEALFDMRGTMSSKIVDSLEDSIGLINVKVTTLDYLEIPPTFIKMDIEGEEYNALIGAEGIITKYRPKLAVSIYHCVDDLYRIPMLIHEMCPDYKFCLKHHTSAYTDTVLYAK